MAFWGIELVPRSPFIRKNESHTFTHRYDSGRGRLHISQATLGTNGDSVYRVLVQCKVGDKCSIVLCSLCSGLNESCTLDIEFEEEDDVVFELLGDQSVHLTGFYRGNHFNQEATKMKKMISKAHESGENAYAEVKEDRPNLESENKELTVEVPSGLVIEEIEMGKPNGRIASSGANVVSVHYIGQLKINGRIFASTIGKEPYTFRLGLEEVIKGFDIGVYGMRIGDKRRLTIPPSMGYGSKQQPGGKVPPDAWVIFEVLLVDVC